MKLLKELPLLSDVGNIADDLISTPEERDNELTDRLRLDTTSPFMLPHLIRPMIALILLVLQILIFVGIFFEISIPDSLIWEIGALNAASIGFYFSSRRAEKLQTKNAQATIVLKKMEVKETIRKEKVQEKISKKERRRAKRAN